MADLEPGEEILVRAFRRWVLGLRENTGEQWSSVWNDFARRFGARDAKEALTGLAGIVKGLQCHARRTIHHHHPCCPRLHADEVSIVCFVAACQDRRTRSVRALAEWMVHLDGVGDLLAGGLSVAGILGRHALRLPQRPGGVAGAAGPYGWPDDAPMTVY